MKRFALSLSIAAAALSAPLLAKPVVITADRYLDVAKGSYVEYPAIFVDDAGRITQIADARTIRLSAMSSGSTCRARPWFPASSTCTSTLMARPTSAAIVGWNLLTASLR